MSFPSNPTINQKHAQNSLRWEWTGILWRKEPPVASSGLRPTAMSSRDTMFVANVIPDPVPFTPLARLEYI